MRLRECEIAWGLRKYMEKFLLADTGILKIFLSTFVRFEKYECQHQNGET